MFMRGPSPLRSGEGAGGRPRLRGGAIYVHAGSFPLRSERGGRARASRAEKRSGSGPPATSGNPRGRPEVVVRLGRAIVSTVRRPDDIVEKALADGRPSSL